jgi:ankyrin repeat protein
MVKPVGKYACITTALVVLIIWVIPAPLMALSKLDHDLLVAVQNGNMKLVKSLIAKGANVNAQDEGGNTALHFSNRSDIARILISAGASIQVKNTDFGMSPLFSVPAEVAALFIAHGANVNEMAQKGMTPLSWAVYWDQLDKIKLLIAKGADVNAQDDDGKTALHIAANWDKKDIVTFLLANGANINAKDKDCWTPLHWAAFEASGEMMDLLLSSGADANALTCPVGGTPSVGETPLDIARKYRSPNMGNDLQIDGEQSTIP